MAVETTAIGCHYSYIAELWFVKQTANSGEVGSLVLGQIFVQNLHAAYQRISARQLRSLVPSSRQKADLRSKAPLDAHHSYASSHPR